ncbi:flavin-containing monooxygenase [Pigmentiphaga kullae]|uniref:flavin-containing monooxygenase n=1 Tax=Pigmentiphaga kullae TaxID=151784 RepID=UPI00102B39E9|nr:NAD(P)/FAD-dependent oxidoreductase [Pigmentiphaga kullae]
MSAAQSTSPCTLLGETEVLVIGAGLGGVAAAAKLLHAGHESLVVLEEGDRIGGVWQVNRYPNVACDTPIDLYAYKFFPGDTWTTNFAPGSEIQTYLERVAGHFGVTPKISFNTRVVSTVWSEEAGRWLVTASDGRRWSARYVVWAGGLFSQPLLSVTKGAETFTGLSVHSTAWDDDIDLEGKRVAVVGGGATSIQIVPYVQERAEKLIAFVRTPSYVSPRPDIIFSDSERGTPEFVARMAERRKEWFDRYEVVTKTRFPMNEKLVREQEATWKELFDAQVKDPHAREVLTPRYRYGCKRRCSVACTTLPSPRITSNWWDGACRTWTATSSLTAWVSGTRWMSSFGRQALTPSAC